MFGKSKEQAPPPSLTDAITRTEGMGDSIQKKVDKLNAQLKTLHEQMKKCVKRVSLPWSILRALTRP